jgi:hypothetical protein
MKTDVDKGGGNQNSLILRGEWNQKRDKLITNILYHFNLGFLTIPRDLYFFGE